MKYDLHVLVARRESCCLFCRQGIVPENQIVQTRFGFVHFECWRRCKEDLLDTTNAALRLNLSVPLFRKVARLEGVPPVGEYYNRFGKTCLKWSPEEIERLKSSDRFQAAINRGNARQKARELAAEAREVEYRVRYPTIEIALRDAANALFRLNRYAKSRSCGLLREAEIYGLKHDLVRYFYDSGYCTEVRVQVRTLPAQICLRCSGGGCGRCGDGEYRPAKEVRSYLVCFQIEGTRYTWHVPGHDSAWLLIPESAIIEPYRKRETESFELAEKEVVSELRVLRRAVSLIRTAPKLKAA